MVLLHYLLYALPTFSVANAYELDKKLDFGNFLSSFDFIESHDKYTGGCASYVSKDEATSTGLARFVGNQDGRKSVRLESHDTIDNGIVIADFIHLPANTCGHWRSSWHNCDYDVGGCSAIAPYGTFGDSSNQNGGGIWATQVEAEGIKIWHFARSNIPADITSDSPDPSKRGMPVVSLVLRNRDISKAWRRMKLIFNTTFCGESAGSEAWKDHTQCHAKTGVASCNDYVAKTPSAFDDVYFLVNSVRTYTR
ncbi:hypothetical protein E8E12_003151 [Didymella heteroderae]|uniref:Hydrolase n=1 Tax=Didymella heteroderae TaxID=1769908 RepID=A0A9P4WRZ9_9PLEO|nr:hypothetical protein E8E12_003151 [Didymella heteroderae]